MKLITKNRIKTRTKADGGLLNTSRSSRFVNSVPFAPSFVYFNSVFFFITATGFTFLCQSNRVLQSLAFFFVAALFLLNGVTAFSYSIPETFFAISLLGFFDKTKIVTCKQMTFHASGFSSVYSALVSRTAQIVFFWRDRFNMSGINTTTVSAKVVTMKFIRNVADKYVVNNTMGERSKIFIPKHSIAPQIEKCLPFPTRNAFMGIGRRNFNFGKDTRKQFAVNGNSIRIVVSHFYTPISMNLIRLVRGVQNRVRAISILPQTNKNYA